MKIVVELSYAEMPADAVLETGAAEILAESTDPTVCVAGHDRRGRWRYFGDGVEEPKTAALQKRIAELEAQVYVPGLWRCAKCSFQLMQATLCASTGNVASRNEPGEKCPNCDVPLWRVTERQAGNEMVDRAEDAFTRLAAVEAERKEALEVMSLRWPPGYSMPQEEKLPAIVRALFDATASRVAELRKDPA